MRVVSLLTDFGYRDHYVGVMKGVIWNIAPAVQIADISHAVQPQNIFEGAFLLSQAYRYFPPETIHVAVVDPGVGTARRPMAARIGDYYFVCPDNGLLTFVIRDAEAQNEPMHFVHLNRPQYWLPEVSRSFHGRDIFAPVAAHLAKGVPLEHLGEAIDNPVRIAIPAPLPLEEGWEATIIYVDGFGNLITNLQPQHLEHRLDWRFKLGNHEIRKWVQTFGEAEPGSAVAMFDSTGYLSLCIVNGNAANALTAKVGDKVIAIS